MFTCMLTDLLRISGKHVASRMGVVHQHGEQNAQLVVLIGHFKRFEANEKHIFTNFYELVVFRACS